MIKKIITIIGITLSVLTIGACGALVHKKYNPPPKAPDAIIVEWEIDKEYKEKHTTLSNGLTLSVAEVKDGSNITWEWTVSGTVTTQQEAVDSVFRIGGVK